MDCEQNLQDPFGCFLWIKKVLGGSSNKHLNDVMTLFLKHLLDHDVRNLPQESLAFMKKKLTSFLQFCMMKRQETEFQPKSKMGYEDLMAAILSFYVDVILCLSRNMSENQKKKESNSICTKVFYCLAPKQEYSFDVLLQLSAVDESSFDLLESLCRKCLTERFLMTPHSYTKFLRLLRKLSQLWPKQLQNELTLGLNVMPPAKYLTWLEKTNVTVYKTLKVKKGDDLKQIRTCLTTTLTSSMLDSVLDSISVSLESLDCEWASLVENESTCQVKGWGRVVLDDTSEVEDDDDDNVGGDDDDESSDDNKDKSKDDDDRIEVKNDEDIGKDEHDSNIRPTIYEIESSSNECDDTLPKKAQNMEVDLTVDSDTSVSESETPGSESKVNKTGISVSRCEAEAVSNHEVEIAAAPSNVDETAVNRRNELADVFPPKVPLTPAKSRGTKRKLDDGDVGSAEKVWNTPSKSAKKHKTDSFIQHEEDIGSADKVGNTPSKSVRKGKTDSVILDDEEDLGSAKKAGNTPSKTSKKLNTRSLTLDEEEDVGNAEKVENSPWKTAKKQKDDSIVEHEKEPASAEKVENTRSKLAKKRKADFDEEDVESSKVGNTPSKTAKKQKTDSFILEEENASDVAATTNEVDKDASSFWEDAESRNLKETLENIVTRLDTSSYAGSVTSETVVGKKGVEGSESETRCIETETLRSDNSDEFQTGALKNRKSSKNETRSDENAKDLSLTRFPDEDAVDSPNNSRFISPPRTASTPLVASSPRKTSPMKSPISQKGTATPLKHQQQQTPGKDTATPQKKKETPLKNTSTSTAKSHISTPDKALCDSKEASSEDQDETLPSKRSLRTNKAVDYFKEKVVESVEESKPSDDKPVKRAATKQSRDEHSESDVSRCSLTSLKNRAKSHSGDVSKTSSEDTFMSQDVSTVSSEGNNAEAEISSSQSRAGKLSRRGKKENPVDGAKNASAAAVTKSSKTTRAAGRKKLLNDDRDNLLIVDEPDAASQGMTLRRSTRIQDKSKN